MGEGTKISWATHTFNPWWGCTKVSPGCKNCYADAFAKRTGHEVWGGVAQRRFLSEKNWREPLRWNAAAEKAGERHRVFCASMADVFEDYRGPDAERVIEARARVIGLVEATPALDWLLLTKRPENVMGMVPEAWRKGFPRNVWLGTTCEDQQRADERIPHLLACPAAVRWVSYEPALGPVDFGEWIERIDHCGDCREVNDPQVEDICPACGVKGSLISTWGADQFDRYQDGSRYADNGPGPDDTGCQIDWIVVGGESGPGARPFDVEWARSTIRQCRAAGVAAFCKQIGTRPRDSVIRWHGGPEALGTIHDRAGADPAEWPEDLRVREFPGARP